MIFAPGQRVGLMRGAEDAPEPDPGLHGVVEHHAAALVRAPDRVRHRRRARRARRELLIRAGAVVISVIPGVAPVRGRHGVPPGGARVGPRRGDHHHGARIPSHIAEVPGRVLRHGNPTGTCGSGQNGSPRARRWRRRAPRNPRLEEIRSPLTERTEKMVGGNCQLGATDILDSIFGLFTVTRTNSLRFLCVCRL